MVEVMSRWQRPDDGFPSDAYFEAVAAQLGSLLADWWREEAWEVVYQLNPAAYADGPLSWAEHGLYVAWRCDQDDEPRHAEDFTGLGWYWVPHSKPPHTGGGDFAERFALAWLAEPAQVASEVEALIGTHPSHG